MTDYTQEGTGKELSFGEELITKKLENINRVVNEKKWELVGTLKEN